MTGAVSAASTDGASGFPRLVLTSVRYPFAALLSTHRRPGGVALAGWLGCSVVGHLGRGCVPPACGVRPSWLRRCRSRHVPTGVSLGFDGFGGFITPNKTARFSTAAASVLWLPGGFDG